ncbi:MAG: transglutaminase-like domain-containing protein [Terrimicrobiaceae bacterium]
MFAQKEALIRLLRENDPETVRLVKEQLAAAGEEGIPELQELMRIDDECVSAHAKDVLAAISGRSAEEEFSLLCHFFGDGMDIEQACWSLAKAMEPGVCILPFELKLNVWGRQFLVKLSGAVSNRERVLRLSSFLSGELDFRGNADNYYCERNSLLTRVIETRSGIPLTLTLIYMMVGSRAAMKIDGINLPGHFIARHGEVYFDPFHRGRILSRADVESILFRQGLELKNCHLQPSPPRQILIRMLANLLYVYDLQGECQKHGRVRGWMQALKCGAE